MIQAPWVGDADTMASTSAESKRLEKALGGNPGLGAGP